MTTPHDALRAICIEFRDAMQAFANDGRPKNWQRYQVAEAQFNAALAAQPVQATESWQPIETAPKDGTRLLLHYAPRRLTKVGKWDAGSCYWSADQWLHEKAPTHWMPLPAPPHAGRRSRRPGMSRDEWVTEAAAFILAAINDGAARAAEFARETAEALADGQEGDDVSEWDDAETAAADEMDCWGE